MKEDFQGCVKSQEEFHWGLSGSGMGRVKATEVAWSPIREFLEQYSEESRLSPTDGVL